MKFRTAALAAAVLATSGLTAASAAPRRSAPIVCNLLVDPKGDTSPVQDSSLDVMSADIVSDSKEITGVIRLDGAPGGTSATSATGRTYLIEFYGHGAKYPVYLAYIATPTGTAGQYGYYDSVARVNKGIGDAKAKVAGNAVYLTVPLAAFARYGTFKPGSRISGLSVLSGRYIGVYASPKAYTYNSPTADAAESTKVYTAGSRSCVKVGG